MSRHRHESQIGIFQMCYKFTEVLNNLYIQLITFKLIYNKWLHRVPWENLPSVPPSDPLGFAYKTIYVFEQRERRTITISSFAIHQFSTTTDLCYYYYYCLLPISLWIGLFFLSFMWRPWREVVVKQFATVLDLWPSSYSPSCCSWSTA